MSVFSSSETARAHTTDAVLTHCSGYGAQVYERFIGTLFDVGFRGQLIVFIEHKDLDTIHNLKISYPEHVQFVPKSLRLGPKYGRYQNYLEYLTQDGRAVQFNRIFLCDSRDLIFQKNLFDYAFDPDSELFVFEENAKIGECTWNSRWMRRLGKDVLEELKDCPILCSGAILGNAEAIISYLGEMMRVIEFKIGFDLIIRLGPSIDGDQALFNYVFHTHELSHFNIKRFSADDPVMVTVHHARPCVNDEGLVVDSVGNVFWCVHQFDRLASPHREKHVRLANKYNLETRFGTEKDTLRT